MGAMINHDQDRDLRPFFAPRALAIVGATRKPGFGYILPVMLREQGWADRTYLVNPRGGELHGYQVLPSVAQLPDAVDLAIVMVGAERAPAALEEIGARGIRRVIVESAGFAETGEAGRLLQARMREVVRRYGLLAIGPNCVGVISPKERFSTVEVVPESLTPGPLGIIAQSGAFGNVLLDGLHQRGLYISKAVTLGNRMDVDESEVLEYFHADPDTRVIMMYLEGAADGRRLLATLKKVCADKPVLVLKSGRTETGRAATASHTGSLSGRDELYDAAFAQSGAIRAETLEELLCLARVFTTQPLPRGPRLGIITSSGSLGALAADVAVRHGLVLPPPSPELAAAIAKDAPAWMNVKNPLDVGPSSLYASSLPAMLQAPGYDLVLAVAIIPYSVVRQFQPLGLTPKVWFGDIVKAHADAPDKPLALAVVGANEFVADMARVSGPTVPVFTSPEACAKSLAGLWRYRRWRQSLGED
jgi:acetate---CoA ligase (ADP-forming)